MEEYPNNNDQFIDEIVPTDDKLGKIANAANNLVVARNRVDDLRTQLAVAEREYNYINEIELPELMQAVGMSEFRLTNGMKLKINKVLSCKLDKNRVDEADEWLAQNGHEGLIKHRFEIPLPRTVTPLAIATLRATLEELGYGFVVNKNIHPQTLNKWAREMTENNEVIPPEYFEVWRGYKTNIQE